LREGKKRTELPFRDTPARGERTVFLDIQTIFILISVNLPLMRFLTLQGGGKEGDGLNRHMMYPILTPALPLKGREIFYQRKISAGQDLP